MIHHMIKKNPFNFLQLFFSVMLILVFDPTNFSLAVEADKGVTCECLASSCAPCEVETGLTFYSAKCGVNMERVKSCKKPTCVAVENQKQCLALLGAKNSDVAGVTPADSRNPASTQNAAQSSSQNAVTLSQVVAGEIGNLEGAARLIRLTGPTEAPRVGLVVYNGDTIETKLNGKVLVHLKDGSEMTIAANSRVRIEQVLVNEKSGTRKVALDLMLGKVRSRVVKKYEGENSYTVKTKTAVAGVRGTDFVASFEPGDKEWVSEIRTLEGLVHFDRARPAQAARADLLAPSQGIEVPVGTYASLTIGPPSRVDDEAEFFKSINDGSMSPVIKMNDDDVQSIKAATEFAAADSAWNEKNSSRKAASSENASADHICSAPHGKFNQCSFTCEGNPNGEKRCRTDLEGVSCVRRLCRANGVWTEPARLPASESTRCQATKSVVTDCGGYW